MNETEYYYKENGVHKFNGVNSSKSSPSLDDFIRDSLKDNGVVNTLREDTNWHTKFARFGFLDPYNSLTGCREYIFFTRPALNLLSDNGSELAKCDDGPTIWNLNNNEYLRETFDKNKHLFYQWMCTKGPFMNMITNSVISPMELPGSSSKDMETAMNIYGSKITYRGTSWASDEQFDFSLEFQDNKYLEMYHLFKIYDEYERLKAIGKVAPLDIYRKNRVIHDQFSVFKFVVGPDGREIIYYARATGCFPTTFPRDSFGDMSNMIGSDLKFSVSFKGHFLRDMSPSILLHFNNLSLSTYNGPKTSFSIKDDMPLFVPSDVIGDINIYNGNRNGDWAIRPLIVKETYNDNGHKPNIKYNLIWLNE